MDEDNKPTVMPLMRQASIMQRSQQLKETSVRSEFYTARLLYQMKGASGLTTGAIAKRMGIKGPSLAQYFWEKRGKGGSSSLRWFLRYAAACGCNVWLAFPSAQTQIELKADAKPIVE